MHCREVGLRNFSSCPYDTSFCPDCQGFRRISGIFYDPNGKERIAHENRHFRIEQDYFSASGGAGGRRRNRRRAGTPSDHPGAVRRAGRGRSRGAAIRRQPEARSVRRRDRRFSELRRRKFLPDRIARRRSPDSVRRLFRYA
ncbi:hypothetical protein SDC9_147398 [bioreactor metagenome]|uniref:Uncharacterized protein n=1 Tax=bioreactor metagenome TaxID=1076179 RepID=A0A645EHG9_9ZZZZ